MKIKLAKSELIHFVGIGGIGMPIPPIPTKCISSDFANLIFINNF